MNYENAMSRQIFVLISWRNRGLFPLVVHIFWQMLQVNLDL